MSTSRSASSTTSDENNFEENMNKKFGELFSMLKQLAFDNLAVADRISEVVEHNARLCSVIDVKESHTTLSRLAR